MIAHNKGKIIKVTSLKGKEGATSQVDYAASKTGILGFTKTLSRELDKYNISVNTICPGFIVTDLNRHNEQKMC